MNKTCQSYKSYHSLVPCKTTFVGFLYCFQILCPALYFVRDCRIHLLYIAVPPIKLDPLSLIFSLKFPKISRPAISKNACKMPLLPFLAFSHLSLMTVIISFLYLVVHNWPKSHGEIETTYCKYGTSNYRKFSWLFRLFSFLLCWFYIEIEN